eukprot:scaffold53060_cov29-Tisochrysis_lutea.AAC.3
MSCSARRRCWTTSRCRRPRKPQRKPRPRVGECSGSTVTDPSCGARRQSAKRGSARPWVRPRGLLKYSIRSSRVVRDGRVGLRALSKNLDMACCSSSKESPSRGYIPAKTIGCGFWKPGNGG